MYLKAKFRCDCGCVSEFDSQTTAEKIYCSNCGADLQPDISEKVLLLLRTMREIPEDYSRALKPALEFVTSPWEELLENQANTLHDPSTL